MLIFISDLHFTDGSTGNLNIPDRYFGYFINHLVSIANKTSNAVREIKIVLLGDIFDLLHSDAWFAYPVDERPWGTNEPAIEIHALTLFDAITDHPVNRRTLQIIRESIADLHKRCRLETEPQLVYLPGNHDRLVNRYSSLRQKVCDCLGIPPAQHDPLDLFLHTFEEAAYGVFARHGHEYDQYNYDGGMAFTEADYQRVPIGDPITTEIVARLPYALARRLDAVSGLSHADKQTVTSIFQEIENVRPLSAVIEWLLYQVDQKRTLKEVIEDTVQEVINYFESLDFVRGWYVRNDKWTDWGEEDDKIQAFLFLLRHFKSYSTKKLQNLAIQAKGYSAKDGLLEAATQEYSHIDSGFRYLVYGHTHDHLVSIVRNVPATPYPHERFYLNTGTWRGRHFTVTQDNSFIVWKNMTYVIFYREGERGTTLPAFESWTGALKAV